MQDETLGYLVTNCYMDFSSNLSSDPVCMYASVKNILYSYSN